MPPFLDRLNLSLFRENRVKANPSSLILDKTFVATLIRSIYQHTFFTKLVRRV